MISQLYTDLLLLLHLRDTIFRCVLDIDIYTFTFIQRLESLAFCSSDRNQCVFVGDQPYDITAGREAGLITVGAVWGSGDMETLSYYHPDKIIHDPHLLIEFLESVSRKKQ